jgi:hypothetical protein
MSHATMLQTIIRCSMNLHADLRVVVARLSYQRNTASGIVFFKFICAIQVVNLLAGVSHM